MWETDSKLDYVSNLEYLKFLSEYGLLFQTITLTDNSKY